MVFKKKIDPETRAYMRFLRSNAKIPYRELVAKYKISRSTLYRITKGETTVQKRVDNRRSSGRPRKLTDRDERLLLRQMNQLRRTVGGFTSKQLMENAGISRANVSDRTVRRLLNRKGYHYLQPRRKGILSTRDQKLRIKFAKRMQNDYARNVWMEDIAFYLDGVSFQHKFNPAGQARAPKRRTWRKPSEVLELSCTAKGHKVGSGGRLVRLMVAVTYNEGILLCEQYEKLNGVYFKSLVEANFDAMFDRAKKNNSRLWIQDGDPSQNSAVVRRSLKQMNADLLAIPPRSPDINPIENLFHIVKNKLDQDALIQNIIRENYDAFSNRVRQTIYDIPQNIINKTIESMPHRMDMILKHNGRRLKY